MTYKGYDKFSLHRLYRVSFKLLLGDTRRCGAEEKQDHKDYVPHNITTSPN
jgi:hypothetical protein